MLDYTNRISSNNNQVIYLGLNEAISEPENYTKTEQRYFFLKQSGNALWIIMEEINPPWNNALKELSFCSQ